MAAYGFVHESLDVKVVILYIMARVAAPIDLGTLTELSLCDGGIDYFLFAPALEQLVESGHLTRDEEGLYAITEKGRTNGGIMESSVSPAVWNRCDKNLARINAILRRDAQITARVEEESGQHYVELGLRDDKGPLFHLRLAVPDPQQGKEMARRFRSRPEDTFNIILSHLLQEPDAEEGE